MSVSGLGVCDLGLIGLFLWWVLKLFFSVSLCLSCFCFGCWGVLGDLEIWALFVGFFLVGKDVIFEQRIGVSHSSIP